MCKRRVAISSVSILISVAIGFFVYGQTVTIEQITVTGGIGQPLCPAESRRDANNALSETATTISADGNRVVFLSRCDLIPGGNTDYNRQVFLAVREGDTWRIHQITKTTTNGERTVAQTNPSISADGNWLVFMSNARTSETCPPTPGPLCPCPDCPGNDDANTEIFVANITDPANPIFRQITNTNTNADDPDFYCPDFVQDPLFAGSEANGWPEISGDGRRVSFHSLCRTTELTPCPNCPGNDDQNIEVFLWTDGDPPTFTQITNTTRDNPNTCRPLPQDGFCGASFAVSITPDGRRVAMYSDRSILEGRNTDGNHEVFVWTEGVGVVQVTDTTGGFGPGRPSLSTNGTVLAFDSDRRTSETCPPTPGPLCPCIGCPGNDDENTEVFLAQEQQDGTWRFSQVTDTRRTDPPATTNNNNNGFASMATSQGLVRVAFWSDRNLTQMNPTANYALFLYRAEQQQPLFQVTPAPDNCSQPVIDPDNPPPFPFFVALPAINQNFSAADLRIAFSYNCNPVSLNADKNNEVFKALITPP